MTDSENKFAIILKCILARKNITQGELAQKAGLTSATITHYITGRSTPTHKNIMKIADCLGVSPQVFYVDANECMPYIGKTKDNLPTNLKRLIDERKITQSQIANEIGVSRQAVSLYVNGTQFPSQSVLEAIANYFGVTPDDLMSNGKENVPEMMVCVKRMPLSYDECVFRGLNYMGECRFGGECNLKDGKCVHLCEI